MWSLSILELVLVVLAISFVLANWIVPSVQSFVRRRSASPPRIRGFSIRARLGSTISFLISVKRKLMALTPELAFKMRRDLVEKPKVKCEIHRKAKYSCDVCQWDNLLEGRGRQERAREHGARTRLDRMQRRRAGGPSDPAMAAMLRQLRDSWQANFQQQAQQNAWAQQMLGQAPWTPASAAAWTRVWNQVANTPQQYSPPPCTCAAGGGGLHYHFVTTNSNE